MYKVFKLELVPNKGKTAVTNLSIVCAVAHCNKRIAREKYYVREEWQTEAMPCRAFCRLCKECGRKRMAR